MRFLSAIYQPTARRLPAKRRTAPRGTHPVPGRRPAQGRRGVALIMVLVITTVMGAIAADLENESQVNLRAAANGRDELQAYFHARSAVELELFILRFQSMIQGTIANFIPIPLFELSGFLVSSDTLKGIVDRNPKGPTDERKKGRLASNKDFADFAGSFWIEEVVDESRRIYINNPDSLGGVGCLNLLPRLLMGLFGDPKYDKLFETLGESRDPLRNRMEIIANIIDWVDRNDTVDALCELTGDQSISGPSEDTRYRNLPYNVNYKPKNGMFNSLAELRMVPGVNDAFMQLFAPYLTVWGDGGGISMQTAEPGMIRAIIRAISPLPFNQSMPGEEERFQRFMQERSLMMAMPPPLNKLSMPVFTQLLQAAQIPFDPARLSSLDQNKIIRFDDVPRVFRITAIGRVNDASSAITVVWRDVPPTGELQYWREE